jgi:hypothetical protein
MQNPNTNGDAGSKPITTLASLPATSTLPAGRKDFSEERLYF